MRLTLLAAALGAMTISLGRVPEADAMCGAPSPAVLPADGTIVPPQPTLYAFIPLHNELHTGRFVVEGAEASIELAAKSPAYAVVRILVRARDPGHRFTVRWRSNNGPPGNNILSGRYTGGANNGYSGPVSYEVGTAAPPNWARVVGVKHNTLRWMCSSEDVIRFTLRGTAIAYRIAWADGSTSILAGDDGAMWTGYRDDKAPPRVATTALGHLNCMSHTVAPEELARRRAFELYALYTDGSEVRIGSSIAQLGKDGVRLPLELMDSGGKDGESGESGESGELREIAPQRVFSADDVWSAVMDGCTRRPGREGAPSPGGATRPSLGWSAAAGALGGAAALLSAALLRRRRHRRDHAPRH